MAIRQRALRLALAIAASTAAKTAASRVSVGVTPSGHRLYLVLAPPPSSASKRFVRTALPIASFLFPADLALPCRAGRRARPPTAPSRACLGDAPARPQHGMGAGQLMGRGADVHAGVVEHEIVEVDQFAFQPQTGAGVGEVGPAIQPSRIGLLARRSSSRATVSSAAASGPAIWAQGSGSGI